MKLTALARRLALAPVLALALAPAVHAELLSADWRVAGDGALMWDTISNREWLRLDYTAGLSVRQVQSQLGLDADGHEAAFYGFTHADVADVWQLFGNAGLTPVDPAPDVEAKRLISSWGLAGADGDTATINVRAVTSDPDALDPDELWVAMVAYSGLVPGVASWANAAATSLTRDESRADTGAALWRLHQDTQATDLPEPSSAALVLAAIGALALGRSRRWALG